MRPWKSFLQTVSGRSSLCFLTWINADSWRISRRLVWRRLDSPLQWNSVGVRGSQLSWAFQQQHYLHFPAASQQSFTDGTEEMKMHDCFAWLLGLNRFILQTDVICLSLQFEGLLNEWRGIYPSQGSGGVAVENWHVFLGQMRPATRYVICVDYMYVTCSISMCVKAKNEWMNKNLSC